LRTRIPRPEAARDCWLLDDYAFAVIACLDAYESTADLSYFRFWASHCGCMIAGFFDPVEGGFFDTRGAADEKAVLGILGTRRKPFQDSPTPAGNSAAAIALLRLHGYTNDASIGKSRADLEVYAGLRDSTAFSPRPWAGRDAVPSSAHTQVVIFGKDEARRSCIGRRCGLWVEYGGVAVDADRRSGRTCAGLAETIRTFRAAGGAVVCGGCARVRLPSSDF